MKRKLIFTAAMILLFSAGYFFGRFLARAGIEFDLNLNLNVLIFIYAGGALLAAVYFIHAHWRKKKNPEKLKQLAIDEKDERNIRLGEKAASVMYLITFLMLAYMTVFFFLFDYGLARWLSLGVLVIHFAGFIICRKIYDKKM